MLGALGALAPSRATALLPVKEPGSFLPSWAALLLLTGFPMFGCVDDSWRTGVEELRDTLDTGSARIASAVPIGRGDIVDARFIGKSGDTAVAVTADGTVVRLANLLSVSAPSTEWSTYLEASPLSIVVLSDTLGVWDWRSAEISYLDPDSGALVGVEALPVNTEDLFPGGHHPLAPPRHHGRLARLAPGAWVLEAREWAAQKSSGTVPAWLLRVKRGVIDTLLHFESPSYSYLHLGRQRCCARGRVFAAQPQWAVTGVDSIIFTDAGAGRLLEIPMTESGDLQLRAEWRTHTWRVNRDLEAHYVRLARAFAEPDADDNDLDAAETQYLATRGDFDRFFAAQTPAVSQLLAAADDDGGVWVRRFDPRYLDGLGSTWDLFGPDGIHRAIKEVELDGPVFDIAGTSWVGSKMTGNGPDTLVVLTIDDP